MYIFFISADDDVIVSAQSLFLENTSVLYEDGRFVRNSVQLASETTTSSTTKKKKSNKTETILVRFRVHQLLFDYLYRNILSEINAK